MFINHVAALIAMTEPGYIFVTRSGVCVAVVVGWGLCGLHFCMPGWGDAG